MIFKRTDISHFFDILVRDLSSFLEPHCRYKHPVGTPIVVIVDHNNRWLLPILVFLSLAVLDLGPMYATERRQTDVRRASSLNASYPGGGA